jgi:cadmium resistance protein CadD (predicted permease)
MEVTLYLAQLHLLAVAVEVGFLMMEVMEVQVVEHQELLMFPQEQERLDKVTMVELVEARGNLQVADRLFMPQAVVVVLVQLALMVFQLLQVETAVMEQPHLIQVLQ